MTRAIRNLRISNSPVASAALPEPLPPSMRNSRRQSRPKQQPREPREYLRCAQCGPVADACMVCTVGGLMLFQGQKHGGQVLLEDSVGQLRWLSRQACVHCFTIRSQRCRRCNSCGFDTPLRELRVGDTFQDRRQPGHQDAAASGTAAGPFLRTRSQCLQENHWTTARFRTATYETSSSLIETSSCSPSSARPRRWHSRDVRSLDTPPVLGPALPPPLSLAPG